MPIYEYRCSKCGEVFEVMQPMGAKPLVTCGDRCVGKGKPGDGKLTRLLSASAVRSRSSRSDAPAKCQRCDLRGGKCPMASGD